MRPRRLGRRGPRDPTVAMRQWWHSLSRFLPPSVASACTLSCGSACSAASSCPGSRIGSLPGHTANIDRRAFETLSGRQVRMATMASSIPRSVAPFYLNVLPSGLRLQFVGCFCQPAATAHERGLPDPPARSLRRLGGSGGGRVAIGHAQERRDVLRASALSPGPCSPPSPSSTLLPT